MNSQIAMKIECAKGEVMNALERVRQQYNLPPCIVDGILSSVLSEVRSETKIELINESNAMMREKNGELEKAKAAAKKVLKTEPEQQEQEENPVQEEQKENSEK